MKKDKKIMKMYSPFFKILLVLAALFSLYNKYWINLLLVLITFLLVFVPKIISKEKSSNPSKIEILILSLLYLSFLFNLEAIETKILWIRITMYLLFSTIICLVGFSLIYFLNEEKKTIVKLNPLFISLFAFTFSISIGTIWQIFRFLLNYLFNIDIQSFNPSDAMGFITINIFGAIIVSFVGYLYLKSDEDKYFIKKIIKSLIGKEIELEENEEKVVKKLIKNGESKKVEFKSTLRTNLKTTQSDKNIENASLKTICAFLNSEGGELIIGVNDDRKICGIMGDNFKNNDKMYLHLSNLIKQNIGTEFSPYIKYKILKINSKEILRITCKKSNKPVFLKTENNIERFYIRTGPSSVELQGSKLIEFIKRSFKN